jgi:hypothetical protein
VFEVGKRQLLFRDPKTSVLNYSEGRNKSKEEKSRCRDNDREYSRRLLNGETSRRWKERDKY